MIPREAADAIKAAATPEKVIVARVAELFADTGLDTVAFVRALAAVCPPEARGYVHWGSTTMDIVDTGLSLQLKEALALIVARIDECQQVLVDLIERHRDTLVIARTHSQHALPITLAFKLAFWLDDFTGHLERLRDLRRRLLVAKVTGAVGSQAAYGPLGQRLQARVAELLGLYPAPLSIQTSHAHLHEFLAVLALVGNTLSQIARDTWNRQRPEIGELAEPFEVGRNVGSTALAGKRNPFLSEWTIGQATMLRSHLLTVLSLVLQDERDGTRIPGEYASVPESCCLLEVMLARTTGILRGLVVDPARMRANLDINRGVILTESVMMALAERGMGRQAAYSVVYDAAQKAIGQGLALLDALWENPEVRGNISREELEGCLDPASYLGTIGEQVDGALARRKGVRAELGL
jgi:adenylosuccinate lyase